MFLILKGDDADQQNTASRLQKRISAVPFSTGRLYRSQMPPERRRSEESGDLDSSGDTLSVDEESPVETQSDVLPVSLKRSKSVLVPKRESNDNAKGKS